MFGILQFPPPCVGLLKLKDLPTHISAPRRAICIAATLLSLTPVLSTDAFAQPKKLTFEHPVLKEATSSLWIPCMYQDRTGYLWFGTVNGAERYDGYSYVLFSHQPGDSTVASWVETMYEDRAGNMWLGTSRGLDKIDIASGRFRHYIPNLRDTTDPGANWVYAIHEDHDGTLLIGTRGGLHLLDPVTEAITSLFHDSTDPGSISSNAVNAIHEDAAGSIWIGTGGGLDRFDRVSGSFIHCWRDPNAQTDEGFNTMYWISCIVEDHRVSCGSGRMEVWWRLIKRQRDSPRILTTRGAREASVMMMSHLSAKTNQVLSGSARGVLASMHSIGG